MCHNVKCINKRHAEELDKYTNDITQACLTAAYCSIPTTGAGSGGQRRVPGWAEYVAPARDESLFWHKIWTDCGRPRSGVVADCMRRTRLAYHYAIRYVRRKERDIIDERFAETIMQNRTRDFWSEVRRIKNCRAGVGGIVDGLSDSADIANMFANKYADLYSSVPYDCAAMTGIKSEINAAVTTFTNDCVVGYCDVAEAVSFLKPNKNDGHAGLSTNHVIHGCDELNVHLSMLYSAMLVHGVATNDLLLSSIIPIPKNKNGGHCDSANYRGIALCSILGKIFDRILLNRYSDFLITSQHQFGFKKNNSTAMCTMVLKETINYYTSSKGTVFCTLLDATKAFDRVKYCKLFRCLLQRKLPFVVLRLLLVMYTDHVTRIVWNGIQSRWFGVLNGVKQGGVMSPILFCVYFDDLLNALVEAKVGCFIGNIFVGVLAYADDVVILAPTASAMRRLLKLCEEYAQTYSVLFNGAKSKCVVCESRSKVKVLGFNRDVRFSMNGSVIDIVGSWAHLGHIISADKDDGLDIMQRSSKLVGQINSVICTFANLDPIVKTKLLKSYCMSLYGSELWDLHHTSIDKLCKSWRLGLRRVWGLPYGCHTAILQLLADTIPMYDIICQRSVTFIRRCLQSDSDLVKSVSNYAVFHGCMRSGLGRNLVACSENFNLSVPFLIRGGFSKALVSRIAHSRISPGYYCRVLAALELIMLKRGVLHVNDFSLDFNAIDCFLRSVCTE